MSRNSEVFKSADKMKPEEMAEVQGALVELNRIEASIGRMEMQKLSAAAEANSVREKINKLQFRLRKKYGQSAILNFQDGSISRPEKTEEDGGEA